MSLKNPSTAVLVFARSSKVEAAAKQLSSSRRVNKSIFRELNKKSISIANASGYHVFKCNEHHQVGASFGERLVNGMESVFSKGYTKVIVIGNDCPELKRGDIKNAGYLLNRNQCVIGPDQRGGTFLIGIRKEAYLRERFINLDWQKDTLVDSISKYTEDTCLTIQFLRAKNDLNSVRELVHYLKQPVWLLERLIILLESIPIAQDRPTQYSLALSFSSGRRGPPTI